VFRSFIKSSYQRFGIMIGHQWKHGGAKHFASFMGAGRDDLMYATLDIVHFDQSALAIIISLILLMPLMTLKDDGSIEYKMTRAMILERSHQMACKLVKWEGLEYRYIIGQVFSGLFVTSWLDTVYMVVVVTSVITLIYQNMKKTHGLKLAREFKHSFMRRGQYGDNSEYAFEHRWRDVIFKDRSPECPLGEFQRQLDTLYGMKLKAEETFLFEPDDTGISPFFTILQPITRDGNIVANNIVRQGPEFLKRNFIQMLVDGEMQIMPWRKEDDMYTKSCIVTFVTDFNADRWSSKYMGLMIDTMGTNEVAYDAMRSMFMHSLHAGKGNEREAVIAYICKMVAGEVDKVDDVLTKVLARTGLEVKHAMCKAMNRRDLMREFVWDEEWRLNWSKLYGVELYNLDGSIRPETVANWNNTEELNFVQFPDDDDYDLEAEWGK